jgi:hypothetical protein
VIVPEGDTSVAAPGAGIENDIVLLQGPSPPAFLPFTHHWHAPPPSAVEGVIEQVPVPEEQPTSAAVYQV